MTQEEWLKDYTDNIKEYPRNDFWFVDYCEFLANVKEEEKTLDIHIGDIYEDCSNHPLICVYVDYIYGHIEGKSLIDGKVKGCSLMNCGPWKMTWRQAAVSIKRHKKEIYPFEKNWKETDEFMKEDVRKQLYIDWRKEMGISIEYYDGCNERWFNIETGKLI